MYQNYKMLDPLKLMSLKPSLSTAEHLLTAKKSVGLDGLRPAV